jgi:DNA-binding transcriptional MerR regulator
MLKRLKIEDNELTNQVKSLILSDLAADNTEFLELIRNPIFEFDTNQSSRMLNYYESKGFLRSTRETEKGKRRFSITDVMILQFSTWHKVIDFSEDFVRELNIQLNEPEPSERISAYELMLMITGITLNVKDFWLKIETLNKEKLTDSITIDFLSKDSDPSFHISEQLRQQFFNGMNGEGSLKLDGKSAKFLPPFIYNIDKYRKRLGLPLVSERNFRLIDEGGFSTKLIDESDANKLNKLPIEYLTKRYDILLEREDNSLFGIELKYLGKDNYIPPNIRTELLVKDLDDLRNALEQEIKMIEKLRKKFSK